MTALDKVRECLRELLGPNVLVDTVDDVILQIRMMEWHRQELLTGDNGRGDSL